MIRSRMKLKTQSLAAQSANSRGVAFARRPKSSASPTMIAVTMLAPRMASQNMIIAMLPARPYTRSHERIHTDARFHSQPV